MEYFIAVVVMVVAIILLLLKAGDVISALGVKNYYRLYLIFIATLILIIIVIRIVLGTKLFMLL